MKKIISTVICIIMICLTFCGCGSYSTVSKAINKTRKLNEISAQMKMEINMAIGENDVSLPVVVNVNAKNLRDDNPTVLTDIAMLVSGNEVTMQVYREDEWGYITVEDEKYKTKISKSGTQYDYTDDISNMLKDIPKDTLKGAKIKKEKSGKYIAELEMNSKEFSEIFKDFMDNIDENYGIGDSSADVYNAKLNVIVENGYISLYNIYFKKLIDDGKAEVEFNATLKYNNPGEKVTITPPKEYKKYEEINNSSVEY